MAFQLVALSPAWAAAPDLEFHAPQAANDAKTSAAMRDLAQRMLPVYQDTDPDRYLENLSALQLVAGSYSAADVSRQELRIRRRPVRVGQPVGRSVVYDMYAYAKAIEAENRVSFSQA
ncbi:MAG: hypothetical protein WA807_02870, partial [Steroidobacteraceae bacterium]